MKKAEKKKKIAFLRALSEDFLREIIKKRRIFLEKDSIRVDSRTISCILKNSFGKRKLSIINGRTWEETEEEFLRRAEKNLSSLLGFSSPEEAFLKMESEGTLP